MKSKKTGKPTSPARPTEQAREQPTVPPPSTNPASHEAIAERARALWRERGQPEGRDLEHWLEAERQLQGGGSSSQQSGDLTTEDIESDKDVDGLVQRPRER